MTAVHAGNSATAGLSVVIPAFNEMLRLPGTLDRLLAELPTVLDAPWEVVVVDDGSTDGLAAMIAGDSRDGRMRVVSFPHNRGKGAALRRGATVAVHPWVLFLDADLPVPVDVIPQMIAAAEDDVDLLTGSRVLAGAVVDPPQPFGRRTGGKLFRLLVASFGFDVTSDPQCGVKLLRTERLRPLMDQMTCDRFGFDVELIVRARRAGMVVKEIPLTWRHVEGSSLRPSRDAVATLRELVALRRRLAADARVAAPVSELRPIAVDDRAHPRRAGARVGEP